MSLDQRQGPSFAATPNAEARAQCGGKQAPEVRGPVAWIPNLKAPFQVQVGSFGAGYFQPTGRKYPTLVTQLMMVGCLLID